MCWTDLLSFFFFFSFFFFLFLGAGWVAGCSKGLPEFVTDWIWILWYENQNCQIVWSWHTPLPPFLFSFMSDLTSSWTIPSNKMDKTSQPTTPELQVLYLLTYFTSLPTELLTKPDWQWCVCMCVCVFFCVFEFVSLSIFNHLSWRLCNLMTFFWVVFSSVFPQN